MKCSVLIVAEGEHELTGDRPDPALTTLVHRLLGDGIDMQSNPEAISDPKTICGALSDAAGRDWRLRDLYSSVAAIVDLRILRARCPTGFASFADRVEGLKSVLSRDS